MAMGFPQSPFDAAAAASTPVPLNESDCHGDRQKAGSRCAEAESTPEDVFGPFNNGEEAAEFLRSGKWK